MNKALRLRTALEGPIGEQFENKGYILVNDRAYGKIERFDQHVQDKHYFVTRFKENVALATPHFLSRMASETSTVSRGLSMQKETPEKFGKMLFDNEGNE